MSCCCFSFSLLHKKDTKGKKFPFLTEPAYYSTSKRTTCSEAHEVEVNSRLISIIFFFLLFLKDNITAVVELENEQSRHVMSFTQITPHLLLLCIILLILLFRKNLTSECAGKKKRVEMSREPTKKKNKQAM